MVKLKKLEFFKDATLEELQDMLTLIPSLTDVDLDLALEWVNGETGFFPDDDYTGQSGARWFIGTMGGSNGRDPK